MATTVYDPTTGEPLKLNDADAAEAVKNGAAGFFNDQPVRVVLPDGRRGRAPADRIGSLLAKGYRLETDEEAEERELQARRGSPLDALGAGALSTVDAVLPGSAGVLARAGGALAGLAKGGDVGEYAELGRQIADEATRANPIASGAGTVVGTGLGLAAGVGAPGLASKVGLAAKGATGALGRAGSSLVGGAAEGGLYGLGQFISEQAITDNPQLSAEKLFAKVMGGAVTGGILSGFGRALADGVTKGGSAILAKFGAGGWRSKLDELANTAAVRQFARATDLRREGLNPAEIQEVGNYGLKRGLFDLGGAGSTFEKAAAQSSKEGAVLGRILSQVDKQGTFDARRFTARATQDVLDPLLARPGFREEAHQIKNMIEDWQKLGGPGGNKMSFSEAWAKRADLRAHTGHGQKLNAVREEMGKLYKILTDEVYDQAAVAAGPASGWLKNAARRYRNAEVIERLAGGAVERQTGNNLLGLGDMGAAVIGGVTAGPAGAMLGVAHHMARTRGGSAFALAAKTLANSKTFSGVGKNLHQFVKLGLSSSPIWGGTFRGVLETAAARGADELLAAHSQLAASDPTYLSALGMAPEDNETASALVGKAERLDGIANQLAEVDAAADTALGRLVGSTPGRAPAAARVKTPTAKEYQGQLQRVQELAQTPPEGASFGPLGDAPSVAAMLAATEGRAAAFLASVAPKPPVSAVPALAQPWAPSATDLRKWAHYMAAVQDPFKLVDEIRGGAVLPETLEAVSSVYPQLLQDVQRRMMERLAQYDQPLNARQRAAIERIWGTPSPTKVALLQAAHGGSVGEQAGTGPSPDGRQVVNSAKNAETQAQRIEARGQGL